MKLKTLKFKNSKILCTAIFAFAGLSAFAQSPGGVSANLTLWLKADNAATITGSPVQTWSTSGGSAAGYNVTQATAANRPTLVNGATNYTKYNYNPSIKFNVGSSTKLFKNTGTPDLLGTNGTAIIVTTQEVPNGSGFTFYSGTTGRYQLKPNFRFQTGLAGTGYTFDWSAPTEYSTTSASMIASYGCATNAALRKNSVQFTTPNNTAPLFNPSISTGLYLGANNASEYSNSSIAEVILFNTKPTLAEMDRVESYLAIKYGITRGGNINTTGTYNYIASDGFAILWSKPSNVGFNNDIAVIGRDDNSGLAQKQSISVNNGEAVTIALGNGAIPTENAANTTAFSNNLSFLAWGNNGLTKVFNTGASKPSGVLERLNRVWKTQASNFSQQTTFGFENSQITGLGTTGTLCLLFDEDGTDLSNATIIAACSAVNTGSRVEFRGIDIPAGKPYFTLARMVTPTLITNNGPICAGNTLNLTAETVTATTTYSWTGPNGFTSTDQNPSIPSVSTAATGTYTVTITSFACTPTVLSTTVTINPSPTPTFTAVSPICSGDSLAALPTTSNEGVTGTWAPALNNTTTTTYTFTPATGQCSIPTTMTIVVNPIVTPTFAQVSPICSGTTLAALPTTSNEGITGVWSPALDNTTTTLYTFTPDADPCAPTATMTITVNTLPTVGGTLSVCAGLTTQLTGSGTPAAANAWLSSDTAVATVDGAGLVTGVSAGTATITYTDSNGCLTTALVTVNALPTISGTLTVCVGETTQLTGSESPATSGAWTSSATSIATIDATGLVTGVSAGTTTITYVNNNGCLITASVEVLPTPTAGITISGASTICGGSTTDITITGTPDATVNYTVNGTSASVTLPASGTVTFTTANLSVQTTYQLVDVTSISGCMGTLSQSVAVNIAAQPTASISGSTAVCSNTSTSITFSGTPGATVEYTVNAGAIQTAILDATGTAIVNTGTLTSDVTYTLVTVTAGTTPNCIQTLTDSVTVTVNQLPTVTVDSPSTCAGTNITVTASPGTADAYSYAWTVPAGFSNPGDVASFSTSTAGTYSVIITNTATGCVSASASGTVTVNPLPTVTVNTTTVCAGASATITATPGTAASYSYAWTVPAGATNPGDVPSFSTTIPGTYSVVITDLTTNCSSASASGAVNNNPLPTVTVNNPSICSGTMATVTATPDSAGTYSYAWTVPSGATDPGDVASFGTFTPGVYSVTITNLVTNCSSVVATGNVSLNPTPTVVATPDSQTLCSGQSTGIQLQGTVPNTTFSWTYTQTGGVTGASNGSGNIISQVLTAGTTTGTVTYTITPTSTGSCTGIPITVTVTVTRFR